MTENDSDLCKLISSENEIEQKSDLQTLLKILSKNDLHITISKCEFFQSSLTFLDYQISSEGIRPPTNRISAIAEFALLIFVVS
mgnify:CR=1 FL=1